MSHVEKRTPGTTSWVDLMTDDTEAARRFYGELFNWTFEVGPPESGHYTMCKLNGRNVAGIGTKPPGVPMPNAWSMYIAVESAEAAAAKIREAGGAVTMGPMDVMGEGRLAIATEPTGATFGVWEPLRHKGMQVVDEPGSFAWTEVATRDLDRAGSFLVKVFGYEMRPLPDPSMKYVTLHVGGETAGGAMQMNEQWPREIPAHWMVYFAVANTDATLAKLQSLGGAVMQPAFDTPYGRMAVVQDPQKATFSVIQLPSKPAT